MSAHQTSEEEGSSPEIISACTLILDLLSSRTVRNKHPLFKPPYLWYFILAALPD